MTDVWQTVRDEREALVEDLRGLDAGQWAAPSLCEGWDVHDVVAHVVDTARTTRVGFVLGMARAGFDFDRQNARGVRRHRGSTPAETLAALAAVTARRTTPPAPLDSRLVEAVVHGEDVRRPLGLRRAYSREAVTRALRLQARTPASFGGAKELLAAVRLDATDAALSVGEGPEVTGPVLSLLLAATGRRAALDDLTGPGLATLRDRVS